VEKIVDKKVVKGRTLYLIKWEGYNDSDNTWEAAEDVFATELIHEFERDYAQRDSAKRKRRASTELERDSPEKTSSSLSSTPVSSDTLCFYFCLLLLLLLSSSPLLLFSPSSFSSHPQPSSSAEEQSGQAQERQRSRGCEWKWSRNEGSGA
jgi:hypothetical protein